MVKTVYTYSLPTSYVCMYVCKHVIIFFGLFGHLFTFLFYPLFLDSLLLPLALILFAFSHTCTSKFTFAGHLTTGL